MGVALDLVNFDQVFNGLVGKTPMILNDVRAFTEEDMDRLNKMIVTTYSGDLLTNIPTCQCDTNPITGKYNEGVPCDRCGATVEAFLGSDLQPITWFRAPDGVEKLMNPMVWTQLKDRFTVGSYNVIHYLCDPAYRPGVVEPPIVAMISQMTIRGKPIQRSYNFFVQNFWTILDALFEMRQFRKKRGETDSLRVLLKRKKRSLFSKHLPVPHRSTLVVEDTHTDTRVQDITTAALDAIRTLASVDTSFHAYSKVTKEGRTVRTIDKLASLYEIEVYRETLARKDGLIRKHVIATRSNWSFRAVISSITDRHVSDEIHLPWSIAISVFRTHLANKLMNRGYTPNELASLLDDFSYRYHPMLDELFQELIQEAMEGRPHSHGIAVSVNRNPSLMRGSIMLGYVSKVKTDPEDNTVGLPITSTSQFNADVVSIE